MSDVTAIKIEFSSASLFDPEGPAGYDEQASCRKFAEQVTRALQRDYPHAEISVELGINDRTMVTDADGMQMHVEAGYVDQTTHKAYISWDWAVRK